jgi:FkbM family methyltransferase
MNLAMLSMLVSVLAVALAWVVGWRARRAHRDLWAVFEDHKKRAVAAELESIRLWQRCYGRLLAIRHGRDKPLHLTAQHGEDVFLMDYFEDHTQGVFVEIGAYDGIQFSNTYALEQLGWTGLLVEAHPDNVEACRRNRPRSVVEHCAMAGPEASGTVTFNVVMGRGGDLLSAVSPDEKHVIRCRREGEGIRTVSVPCMGFDGLMQRHPLPRIDFLSIDIEGGEIDALRGVDFERLRPRLILLEANGREERERLHQFMAQRAYRPLREFGVNVLFEDQQAGCSPQTADGV